MVVARNYSRFRQAQRLGGGFIGGAGGGGDPILKMIAHRNQGAGYSIGAAPLTGDGTAKTYSVTLVNNSGAPIEEMSLVVQGWTLRTSGFTDTGNNFDITGNVEYPVGGTTTDIGTLTNVSGQNTEGATLVPTTVIPNGASFKVNLSSTVPNGQKYIEKLGFAGLRNHAKKSVLKKIAVGAFGDSIMTNNGSAIYNAALTRCGAYINSIAGTTAATYGANNAANFVRQVDLCVKLGITHVISNFGTNDYGGGTALATLQGYLTAMRDAVRAAGMKFVQCTMLPRTKVNNTPVTTTSVTSSGNIITVAVPDATKFIPDMAYNLAGANETEYNGTKYCTAVDTVNNTLSLLFIGSASATATGTITIVPWKPTAAAAFMEPLSAFFDPGANSPRGLFNAWVRGGAFDDYIDWGDACEPSRDSGRWLVAGESPQIPAPQLITVSSVISTSRFNSNYNRGSSTIPNGFVQPLTGTNIGVIKNGNGNTNGDITVTSAFANAQAVGHQYYAMPGVSYTGDDGTHVRVAAGGKGGQSLLDNASAAWLDVKLAA
ncbi:hypothetical protein P106B_14 [Rhizobium phage vB_RglS_P106B]|uniref:Uncharacterized protein n=1 Tax=Rhizobium phage vB_RglS_P106B TaxID=1458697 RepID=W6EC01_9CAUD|nr:hypothetical protein P106B_14 [Rhizobium phage vB_RglS_P106B]AHJ10697.1 hypothetical protein P106B_14 [Rhizobium phage vB_RglS_P106B]